MTHITHDDDGKMIMKDDGCFKNLNKSKSYFTNPSEPLPGMRYCNDTNIFTIDEPVKYYSYYIEGRQITIFHELSVKITQIKGVHYIYLGMDGKLFETTKELFMGVLLVDKVEVWIDMSDIVMIKIINGIKSLVKKVKGEKNEKRKGNK